MTDDERDALTLSIWEEYLDRSCICGFPHPKAPHTGPPPTLIERDGVQYQLPTYPGVMGGYHPIEYYMPASLHTEDTEP